MIRTPGVVHCVAALLTLLTLSTAARASVGVVHPNYTVINEFDIPAGLTAPLGDLLFSAAGATAYILDNSEQTSAAVWALPVTRNAAGHVTAFGTATQEFTDSTMDTGLSMAPNGSTLFYRTENAITQRLPNGTTEDKTIVNYSGQFGGLAFVPVEYSNAGNIVTASYDDGALYLHQVTDDGDGTYSVADGSLYADLFLHVGIEGLGDVGFITSGPLADSLLVAGYNDTDLSLFSFPLDPVTGLPLEGTTPTPIVVATGSVDVWGVEVDSLTGNLWVVEWLVSPPLPGSVHLVQIAPALFADGFESGDTTAWSD